jgi:hypothetical protein
MDEQTVAGPVKFSRPPISPVNAERPDQLVNYGQLSSAISAGFSPFMGGMENILNFTDGSVATITVQGQIQDKACSYSGLASNSELSSTAFQRYAGIASQFDESQRDPNYYKSIGKAVNISDSKYQGIPLTKSYKEFGNLYVIYVKASNLTSISKTTALDFGCVCLPVPEIRLARMYYNYRKLYVKAKDNSMVFGSVKDKWLVSSPDGNFYIDLTAATFHTKSIPLKSSVSKIGVIAVYGTTI